MKKLTCYYPSIVAALKESSLLVVSADGKKVKCLNPLPFSDMKDSKLFTVLVEIYQMITLENIRKIFGEAGNIKSISICEPHAIEESKRSIKERSCLLQGWLHGIMTRIGEMAYGSSFLRKESTVEKTCLEGDLILKRMLVAGHLHKQVMRRITLVDIMIIHLMKKVVIFVPLPSGFNSEKCSFCWLPPSLGGCCTIA